MKVEHSLHPLKRIRFFSGQLLTTDDFSVEQKYNREKQRRHNQYGHGFGVILGLEVDVRNHEGQVNPGIAYSCTGDEIIVSDPVKLILSNAESVLYVVAHYSEKETDPVPVPGDEETIQYSRIEESFEITLEKDNPCVGHRQGKNRWFACGNPHGVTIAKLIYARGAWKIGPRFCRPQAG
jgi:hypothetical protein